MTTNLGNLGLEEALDGKETMPASYSDHKKKTIMKKAFYTLILNLGDKVLGKVSRQKYVFI